MKVCAKSLALLGGRKLFPASLPVGQINIPRWELFQEKAGGIFKRHFFTNFGVLTRELEVKLAALFKTKHCLAVTNATIGLSIACRALGLEPGDKVVVPAFTFAATVQALTWAGLEPVFCDVDAHTHNISAATVAPCLNVPGVQAILGVHLWGNGCDINEIETIANAHEILIFFDAAHAVSCTYQGKAIGGFGLCEIFSMHATKVLSCTEGGCITTNDDCLATIIRNIRSSYGRDRIVPVSITANARFSELQAAFGLLSLEDLPTNIAANKQRMDAYAQGLKDIPGIRVIKPPIGEKHNYQYVVLEVDERDFGLSRDALVRILEAENVLARRYFVPGMHRCFPYKDLYPQYVDALPVTDWLCQRVMQLPSGQIVTLENIADICDLVRFIHHNASAIRKKL